MGKITLNQLEMLVSAVDFGGFSAASTELGCTQSRISHAVAELERLVGARLLIRSRSGCIPTSAGRRVLTEAREMLRMAEGLVEGAPREGGFGGNVRIACIRSVATYLVPSAIEAVGRKHPDVELEVDDGCHDYGDVLIRLDEGRADIGITRGPVGAHLVSRPYISDSYVVIAPASTDLRSPVNWSELAHLPFIHIQQPGAAWIVEQCRAAGCHQSPARRLVNESGVLALVARGLGFAVLPRLTAFPEVPGTQVLALPQPIRRHLVLVVRPAATKDACVGLVTRLLLDKSVARTSLAWRAGTFAFDY